ncbi:MAG: hypothetical protein IPK53_18350 [bacterium]|nr:hypothetical protein [bacterium]
MATFTQNPDTLSGFCAEMNYCAPDDLPCFAVMPSPPHAYKSLNSKKKQLSLPPNLKRRPKILQPAPELFHRALPLLILADIK